MALDKTEAVNLMLAAVGEQPVSSGEVTTPTQPEVVKAVRILDWADRNLQLEKPSFSLDYNVELTPAAGIITLASDVISIEVLDLSRQVSIKAGKLWDRENQTFTWSGPIRVNRIVRVPFADMPEYAVNYIVAKASRTFAEQYLGELQPGLREDEKKAEALYYRTEMNIGDYRLTSSPDLARAQRRPPLDWPHL